MKRKIAIISFLIPVAYILCIQEVTATQDSQIGETKSAPLHSYTTNSVLSQGTFRKIRVTESGVYKLSYEDLTSIGLNPEHVRVFGYGGAMLEQDFSLPIIDDLPETPVWMEKGIDGIFNTGDYILFYAQGTTRWQYNKSKSMFTHTSNTYADAGYYFITSDAGPGKKIQGKSITLPSNPTINPVSDFTDYLVHERDLINLVNAGKEFYGETFNSGANHKFIFSFPNPV